MYDRSLSLRRTPLALRLRHNFRRNKYIYIMALPVIAYYLIFMYWPMYGAQIAFKRFSPGRGILGSPWIGISNYIKFFGSFYFGRIFRNTVLISVYGLVFSFPAPILLALMLNELRSVRFKRAVQTISYLPHFISIMVMCGMILDFTRSDGVINDMLGYFGLARQTMLLNPGMFRSIYIISEVWQGIGWGSIIYLSALAGIDTEQYEAAVIDGAGRFQKMLHVTLPGIAPTIVIMLILRVGQMMNVGYEKIILLYNGNTYETADVISTFVYRKGLVEADYSYSTAVGLFNSCINLCLLLVANTVSRRVGETSLW
ncbi:MAG TPA: ABC transporter permease subunit [Clostridia bacterium]|nr:ABC transporter permease subunit [Clostridia bacterium]